MLERQPDEVVDATLWELEQTASAALPRSALVRATRSACGGYDVLAEWTSAGVHGNPTRCTLTLHVAAREVRAYCRLNHPKRENIRHQLSQWLRAQVAAQVAEPAAGKSADTGFDLHCTAPWAFFYDDADPIRIDAQDKAHDFALYRGAPPPPLT